MTTGYTLPSRPPHPSLEGFHHPHPPHSHLHQHPPHHHQPQRQGQTCIPSLIPPGIDPAQVDIRTFYPYQPNEVKHRKRTTRSQLRVLESVYMHDTKPNAMLRKKLAEELGMTPRGVQVWFQNRRAKEKNLAKKLDGAVAAGTAPSSASPSISSTPALTSSTPPLGAADGDAAPSDALSDADNTSTLPEGPAPAPTSPSKQGEKSQSRSAAGPSLALPTIPALPTLNNLSSIDTPEASPSASRPGPNRPDWHPSNSYSAESGLLEGGYASAQALGVDMGMRMGLSAAEILAQRRPSLPILSLPSGASSSPTIGGPHMSPSLGLRSSGRMVGNGISAGPIKGMPAGFDPNLRRRSVDTNIRRLVTHPYAQLAQYTNGHSGHGHGFAHNSSGLYGVGPSPVIARRSYSHAPPSLDITNEDLGGRGQNRTYFITPTSAHPQSTKSPQSANQALGHQNRPMLTQRMSMPSFHADLHHSQSSSRSVHPRASQTSANGSYSAGGLGMFTNPFQSPLSAPIGPSSASTSTTTSAHNTPSGSGYDTPISPLALPTGSPSTSVAPLPIAQSFSGSGSPLAGGIGRRYARHDHQDIPYAPFRSVPAPVPGPLPDASFSFGLPAATSSPASGSPGALTETPSGFRGPNGVVEEEGDDASAASSTYDPFSRFGSLASVADSESSWTSAYWSDAGQSPSQGRKLSHVENQEGYDTERRGSIASGYLPQLFGELDVNGSGTPQPMADGTISPEQQPSAPARRRSSASPHEQQQAFPDAFQRTPEGYSPHESFAGSTPPVQESYASEQGSYSPSSTISAGSHNDTDGKSVGEQQRHTTSPPMTQHSRSSELMYALHPSTGMEDLGNGQNKMGYSTGYCDSSSVNGSDHSLSPGQSQPFSPVPSKPSRYASQAFTAQEDVSSYSDMTQSHMSSSYPPSVLNYSYNMYTGTPIYANGAIDLGSMCVPVSVTMDGIHVGNYQQS